MERIYANEEYCTSDDKGLVGYMKKYLSIEDENEKNNYYKALCNAVRESWQMTELIGLALNDEENTVAVIIFNVKATENNFYEAKWDEEESWYYIEIEVEAE